jgi:hypothetical protein
VLVLDMIEILPPMEKFKYDTWRILPVKCYIDNSVHLRSFIRNINSCAVTNHYPMGIANETFCHLNHALR